MESSTNALLHQEKISFQRRTEQLDWRKIASVDIDKLIQESDTSQLVELIRPVTFCKADSEFDSSRIKIDPAFIKVFRISQLISEFLLASQESSIEKLNNLQEKYNETEHEKEKLSEKILHLKESLTSAKKELKKRTETLASTQSEMLGENNRDEFDQCPYCSKRFISPPLLLAHLQRRHQGLPMNPLFPSAPLGPASVACQSSYQQQMNGPQNLMRHPLQQAASSLYDSQLSLAQSTHQGPILMNQPQMFPSVPTPSPSILHGNNLHQLQSNMSFSGSVTSLNNLPLNQSLGNMNSTNFPGMARRESFTQTVIPHNEYYDLKSLSRLELLPEEKSTASKNHRQEHDHSHDLSNDKLSPDSLNPLNSLAEAQTVDGSHHLHDNNDASGGGGDVRGNISTLSNGEWIEPINGNVLRVQNQANAQWPNLDRVKVSERQGITAAGNAPASELEETPAFSRNPSSSLLKDDGESSKRNYSADARQSQSIADGEKNKEYEELKRILQESVQGELKSLISRLESQEQLWQNKLALLQQDHERQIQLLRQELQVQTSVVRNNNGLVSDGNEVVRVNDKFEPEREIRDTEERQGAEMNANETSENIPPPSGIILVGPKSGQSEASGVNYSEQFKASTGASRETLKDLDENRNGESSQIPIAKPRRSKTDELGRTSHFHSDASHMLSSEVAPETMEVTGTITQQTRPSLAQRHPENEVSQLQEQSSSDSGVVAIIHTEEHHEGKHDNSILPNSTYVSAPGGTTIVTEFGGELRYQKQHPLATSSQQQNSASHILDPDKSGSRAAEVDTRRTTQVKSDDVSDYTLSESVRGGDDEAGNENNDMCTWSPHKNDRHYRKEFADQPRGKSSLNHHTRGKKKYILDRQTRKLVEVSPGVDSQDEDDYEQTEQWDANGDLNNTSSADEFTSGGRKRRSQVDLVRAKTEMELDQSLRDIGLNPESTAIGLEEMKRALKHLKTQQLADHENVEDYESFVKERNAVKAYAKFEAAKSSIDEKLDALSTLSSKKSGRNSLVKIFSAVKSSGKSFKQRVSSAVKKKEKPEKASDDEKRKRKSLSAPAPKKSFFSWTRKKKSAGKTSSKKSDEKTGEQEVETSSEESSTEGSDDDQKVETFMKPSNTRFKPFQRTPSQSSEEGTSGDPKRLISGPVNTHREKSAGAHGKPLKRLNSSANATTRNTHSREKAADPNSTESSPFSNVEEYDEEYEEMRRNYENNDKTQRRDNERPEIVGNKTQPFVVADERKKELKNSTNLSKKHVGKRNDNDISTHNDEDNGEEGSVNSAGMTESEDEEEDDEESVSGDSGESDSDAASYAASKEILANSKSSRLLLVNKDDAEVEDNEASQLGKPSYISSGKSTFVGKDGKGKLNEISDSRLKQIRSFVSRSKEELQRDEILLSEEDFCEEEALTSNYPGREEGTRIKNPNYDESKQTYQRERKLAFTENNKDGHKTRPVPGSHSGAQQRWAAAELINFAQPESETQKETRTTSNDYFRNEIEVNSPDTSKPEVFPRKLFQFSENEEESEWSIDTHKLQDANTNSTWAKSKPRVSEQQQPGRFLTSTPVGGNTRESEQGRRETAPKCSANDSYEDLEDLLKSEISDDEQTIKESKVQQNMPKSPANSSKLPVYTRKPANIPMIQPTNHKKSALTFSNLKTRAEEQNKLLQETGRSESRNSWDSQR